MFLHNKGLKRRWTSTFFIALSGIVALFRRPVPIFDDDRSLELWKILGISIGAFIIGMASIQIQWWIWNNEGWQRFVEEEIREPCLGKYGWDGIKCLFE